MPTPNDDIYHTLELDEDQKQPKKKLWLIITVVAVVLIGTLFSYWYFFMRDARVTYETEPVVKGKIAVTVSATGNLEPTNTVNVGTEISGTIKTVYADYNDPVKKGTVLAELDTAKLRSRVTSLEANLEAAYAALNETKAALTHASNEYERAKKMLKSSGGKLPSAKDVDAIKATYERARATRESARAQVRQAQALLQAEKDDLAKATVTSPIDGIVLVRNVEPGQTVAAALQTPILFTLAENLSQMDLAVSVDEADIGTVNENQKATFSVDAYPDKTFEATISTVRLNSQVVDGVVTYEAILHVDNSDLLLRPGMTATAEITVKTVDDALLVPNAALRYTPSTIEDEQLDDAHVWLLQANMPLWGPSEILWLLQLQESVPLKVPVEILGTDGVKTAIKSDRLTTQMSVITNEKP